jgi:hypothetical protein
MAGSFADGLGLAAGAVAEPALGAEESGGAELWAQPMIISVSSSRVNVKALLMIFSPGISLTGE